jgi:hypothetical protein
MHFQWVAWTGTLGTLGTLIFLLLPPRISLLFATFGSVFCHYYNLTF